MTRIPVQRVNNIVPFGKPQNPTLRQSPWGPVEGIVRNGEALDELRIHAPALASGTSLTERLPELLTLQHPSLARIDGARLDNGMHFLTQVHQEGHFLDDGRVGWDRLQGGLEGLLDGLALLHRTIGAHGAIGPRSLLLTPERLVLLDMGLGNLFEPSLDPVHAMPGEPQTPAHDLYALGAWIHDAWSGRAPFLSTDVHVLRQLHRQAPPPLMRGAPMVLNTLVQRLMAKLPEHRPSIEEALSLVRSLPKGATRSAPGSGPELEHLGGVHARWPLTHDSTIGRAVTNEICVADAMMGRRHARFVWREGFLWVEDLGSANGLYLNDKRTDRSILKDGDKLRVGTELYLVRLPQGPEPTETAAKK